MAAELLSLLLAPPGGVMTDEVGVVTGTLELRTALAPGGDVGVHVRYAGALDWYRVTGTSGVSLDDAGAHGAVHQLLRGVLHRPEG